MIVSKSVCNECPFRKKSAPGWLGSHTPEEFIDATLSENDIPCHMDIDYEDENWRDAVKNAKRCTGSLIFFRNNCKLPKEPKLLEAVCSVESDRDNVFSFRHEFLEHHGNKNEQKTKRIKKTS